jgi:hypothetical protein
MERSTRAGSEDLAQLGDAAAAAHDGSCPVVKTVCGGLLWK